MTNLDFASLSNVPGGSPSPDINPYNYGWDIVGGLTEGIFNPVLTVQDLDSNVILYDPLEALTDFNDGLNFYKHFSLF